MPAEPTVADIEEAIRRAEAEQDDIDKARDLLALALPSRDDDEPWPLADGVRALHAELVETYRRAVRYEEREFAAEMRAARLRHALVAAHVWLPFPSPVWTDTKRALDEAKGREDSDG